MSRTLILVKPDAFERALTGEVIARFERKGLRIVALKTMQADKEIANAATPSARGSPSSASWSASSPAAPLVAMVLEGRERSPAARR